MVSKLRGFNFLKFVFKYPIFILGLNLVFGSFLDNYHPTIQAIFEGTLTFGKPFSGFYFVGFLFIDNLIALAYESLPSLPWYLLYIKFISILGVILFFEILVQVIKIKNELLKYSFVNLVSLSLLFSSLVFLDVTFWSVLFIGLIPIYFFVKTHTTYFAIIVLNIIGVLLSLTRFDTSFLVLCFVFLNLFLLNKKYFFSSFKKSFVVFGVLVIISIFHFSNNYFKSEYVFKSSPISLYMVSDGGFRLPRENFVKETDKIKYDAVVNHFYNDHKNITPSFISSMIYNPFEKDSFGDFLSGPVGFLILKTKKILKKFPAEIVTIFILLFGFKKRFIVPLFLFFLMYLGLGLLAKVEARFILPAFYCLIPIFIFLQIETKANKVKLTALILTTFISFYLTLVKVQNLNSLQLQNSNAVNKIEFLTNNGVVFFDNESVKLLNTSSELKTKPKNFLTIDLSEFPLWPNYQIFLKEHCNCNTLEFVSFFKNNEVFGKQAFYCTSLEKMDFIKAYLDLIYNFELNTSIVESNLSPSSNLILFKIE